jgi:alcohol dehydrogenase class IV
VGGDQVFQARLNLYAGPGCLASLARAAGGGRIMVVTDTGCDAAGILDQVLAALLPARPVGVCAFLAGEPTFTDVSRVCAAIDAGRPGCLVAVGGGSAIDLAKAAAALATNGGSVRDYAAASYSGYRADALHRDPLPVVAVPTTAGTGSEVTRNAAISDPVTGDKLAMRSPRLVPRAQILDPGLLRTCPASVAAHAGLDAAAHALEGMLSTLASPASDELAVDAVRRLVTALPGFCREPADPGLAMQMQIGSLLAGLVLNDCATVAGHALARALGAAANLAHGLSVALVIAEVIRFNAAAADRRLASAAAALGLDPGSPAGSIAAAIENLRDALGIPARLRDLGVTRGALPPIAAAAARFTALNPRHAGADELLGVLENVF